MVIAFALAFEKLRNLFCEILLKIARVLNFIKEKVLRYVTLKIHWISRKSSYIVNMYYLIRNIKVHNKNFFSIVPQQQRFILIHLRFHIRIMT